MRYESATRDRALAALAERGLGPAHLRLIELAGANRRVLELGCASGYMSEALAAAGCQVTGVEIDPAGELARPFLRRLILGDIERDEVFQQLVPPFDAVIAGDVLEHLTDPQRLLQRLLPLLAPDGFVLASIPNVAFFTMRWELLRGRFTYSSCGLLDRTHLRFYTFYSFQAMVREAGYRVDGFWINEGRLPLGRLWRKPPWIGKALGRIEPKIVRRFPNLLGFHFTFRLRPA